MACLLLVLLGGAAAAQAPLGRVTGTVLDDSAGCCRVRP
jgi:hypothetical protein